MMAACVLATGLLTAPGARAQAPRGVPVTTAAAKRADFDVYLRGLGQVQAINAVQVRARVDGTLMKVPVQEGQTVKTGELLAVIDPRPYQAALDQAQAKLAADQADLANAKLDLSRYASLAKQDFASHQQLDTQQALVNRSTAAIAGDEAAIEQAKLNLSYAFITSPIDGRVGLRQIDPGNMIRSSEATAIMSVMQVQPIAATFTLPQDQLPQVVAAMAAGPVPAFAYAQDDKTLLDKGTLLTPDNAIDPATGTIRLKASFPNPSNALWPGQFVNVRVLVRVEKGVVTVPSVAVQHGPAGLYAYVVSPDGVVARRDITVGLDNGAVTVVTAGVAPGDMVVTAGQSRLQDGTRVVANAEAEPGGAAAGGKPAPAAGG
ncbi:MAG: efflux RND transporter periplasmic adaptor subunit [Proteobacteria bacterium]|nr:efflux RND transporter periplasmic adaptor subunit [Pseudomonadota bacterium]